MIDGDSSLGKPHAGDETPFRLPFVSTCSRIDFTPQATGSQRLMAIACKRDVYEYSCGTFRIESLI